MPLPQTTRAATIWYGSDPAGGPKTIYSDLDFSADATINIDLSSEQRMGTIEFVQTLWIDNTSNTSLLTIQVLPSGQTIKIPGGIWAYIPVMSNQEFKCTVSTTPSAALIVKLGFINVQMDAITSQDDSMSFLVPNNAWFIPAGDSITDIGGSASATLANTTSRGFWAWGLAYSGGTMRPLYDAGISGDTSQMLRDRYQTDVLDKNPGCVGMMIGTNDVGLEIATATTTGNIQWMIDRTMDRGLPMFLGRIFPRGGTIVALNTNQLALWNALNNWIITKASSRIKIVDVEPEIGVGDTNHMMLDTCCSPAEINLLRTHPSNFGGMRAGVAWGAAFKQNVTPGDTLFKQDNAVGNLITSGFMLGTGGTKTGANVSGNVATGWNVNGNFIGGATVVCNKIPADFGEWQEIVVTGPYAATNARVLIQHTNAINLAAGQRVQMEYVMQVDLGTVNFANSSILMQLNGVDSMDSIAWGSAPSQDMGGGWDLVVKGMPFTLTVPRTSVTTFMQLRLLDNAVSAPGAVTMRFKRVGLKIV